MRFSCLKPFLLMPAILLVSCSSPATVTTASSEAITTPTIPVINPNRVAGVVQEKVMRENREIFLPSANAEIQLRTSAGIEISNLRTNLRGEFSVSSELFNQGQEYILVIRTIDRRATLNFVYEPITANQFEITVADDIVFSVQDKRYQIMRRSTDNPNQVRPFN